MKLRAIPIIAAVALFGFVAWLPASAQSAEEEVCEQPETEPQYWGKEFEDGIAQRWADVNGLKVQRRNAPVICKRNYPVAAAVSITSPILWNQTCCWFYTSEDVVSRNICVY